MAAVCVHPLYFKKLIGHGLRSGLNSKALISIPEILLQAEDEAAAEAAVLEEWEAQGADWDEPDPHKFTDPWDESYNAMDDYWYY
jgi:hypothetical protein